MQNDCSGPLVAHDALALGSGESFNQTSITATSLVSKTAIQSEIPSKSVALAPSCLAPQHHSESLISFSGQGIDLGHLKDPHLGMYES